MEVLEESIGPKDLGHVAKGKRTKRQRLQSPIPFTITAHSSSGDGVGGHGSNEDTTNINNTRWSSPASSAEFAGSTTEEEEDTAKCLILLAQGHSRESPRNQDEEFGSYKFTSKRYLEAPATANGKVGIYVYECKTCNRTFPSFQALGGHRASHKKTKSMAAAEKKPLVLSDEEEAQFKNNISSLSLQLGKKGVFGNTKPSKVHECSICGTEFTSGQALGGHMRRHRAPVDTNTTLSLSPISMDQSEEAKQPRHSLPLDLNLPAPEDDHTRDKFAGALNQQYQQQQQQQSTLGLSATPTMVDCHY
ncbi:unnamed protein product [Ilex paraguariensis]|uniref:C2H2-type domain-containing protein n=1 Tax=Ilex paraguariensis TaxID=185542 RepID=A0ABC8SY31_9AQUA